MVGDDLNSDVFAARAVGMTGVLCWCEPANSVRTPWTGGPQTNPLAALTMSSLRSRIFLR